MAIYEVQAPDGSVFEIEGPDDATDDQIAAFAESQFAPSSDQAAVDRAQSGYVNPAEGMTGGERFAAGAGAGASRVMRGVRQLGAGMADLASGGGIDTTRGPMPMPRSDAIQAEEMQARELEAPLLDTPGGAAGNIAGTVGAIAPTALIPGAATLPGAAMIGGVSGFAGTPGTTAERAEAAKAGFVGAPAGIAAGRVLGAGLRLSGGRAAAAGVEDAGTRAAIRAGREAGFKLPPSEMARTGPGRAVAQTAEWFSGRAAVPAKFSALNQRRANELVRGDIGLRGKGQITEADVAMAKRPHLAVYEEAAQASPQSKFALEQWRATNDELRRVYKIQNRNPTLEGKREIERLSGEAQSWLSAVESEAGSPGLVQRLSAARKELGKIGSVEGAVNERGDVVSAELAGALDRGLPLSGGMRQVAKFAAAFPRFAQKSTQAGWMSGSPPLAPSLGSGGAFLMGEPITAAALLAAPYATRNALASRMGQAMAAPSANPGAWRMGTANALTADPTLRALSVAGQTNALLRR